MLSGTGHRNNLPLYNSEARTKEHNLHSYIIAVIVCVCACGHVYAYKLTVYVCCVFMYVCVFECVCVSQCCDLFLKKNFLDVK